MFAWFASPPSCKATNALKGTYNNSDHPSKMAAPKDERISVPIDDPNADTEW